MIKQQSVTALIPARGNSKGLPGKNIKMLGGKPLINWTIDAARKSQYIDNIVLSSDDAEIINIARQAGCQVPFVRPSALAQDNSSTIDVINHAIEQLPEFDILVLLQATSPFRHQQHINQALDLFLESDADSCVSVCKSPVSPYWMYTLDEAQHLRRLLDSNNTDLRRQALPTIYALNGAIYIIRREQFIETRKLVGPSCTPYVMDSIHSIDIDYALDFCVAQTIVEKGLLPAID